MERETGGASSSQKPAKGKGAAAGGSNQAAAAGAPGEAPEAGVKRKPGIFTKDLRSMMYGFGDDPEPLQESVELMEDMVVDYLTDMVHLAQDLPGRKGKVSVEDVLFLVRKDPRKFARAKELLAMNERLKKDRAINFQDNDMDESMLNGI